MEGLLEGLKGPALSSVSYGYKLGPLGADISKHQSVAKLSSSRASIMTEKIYLNKTWCVFLPSGMGSDRDLLFKQRARFGFSCWF